MKAELLHKSRVQTKQLSGYKHPYPAYRTSKNSLAMAVPYAIVFGFIVTFPIIVKRVTAEKVNKSREMFRVMGLSDWIYWSTTLFSYAILVELQALVMTILFSIKWSGK